MDRLKYFLGDSFLEPDQPTDYFEIVVRFRDYEVTRETATDVVRRLDQLPPPEWITFRDLAGAVHRVLANGVIRISESTAAQRAAQRAFDRARKLEAKQDRRPWEDDD